jgi:hypothetical protein
MEKVDKAAQHKHNVAEAIADSLAEFVQALHDAAGQGQSQLPSTSPPLSPRCAVVGVALCLTLSSSSPSFLPLSFGRPLPGQDSPRAAGPRYSGKPRGSLHQH